MGIGRAGSKIGKQTKGVKAFKNSVAYRFTFTNNSTNTQRGRYTIGTRWTNPDIEDIIFRFDESVTTKWEMKINYFVQHQLYSTSAGAIKAGFRIKNGSTTMVEDVFDYSTMFNDGSQQCKVSNNYTKQGETVKNNIVTSSVGGYPLVRLGMITTPAVFSSKITCLIHIIKMLII
ncbi:MAG: hypothetical protein LC658_12330 [Bacteroidales bacterium]|nr:hypothetical protein [Bacteroidales bacterium]